jgi:hypothetical protein
MALPPCQMCLPFPEMFFFPWSAPSTTLRGSPGQVFFLDLDEEAVRKMVCCLGSRSIAQSDLPVFVFKTLGNAQGFRFTACTRKESAGASRIDEPALMLPTSNRFFFGHLP